MLLVRKETQSSQVADILEKKIISGEILPETKLSSTRDMANLFSVSQQVIQSAVILLEEKNLVIRKPRRGVYVARNVYSPTKTEIICLKVGNNDLFSDYSENFYRINDGSCDNLDIITKAIAPNNFTEQSFAYELKKLVELNPDCVLICIPQISENQVKQCLELPFPVVFAGDFACEKFPDLQYNQIVEDTGERAATAINKAIELGKKKIVCIAGPLNFFYNRIYHDSITKVAEEKGVELLYVEHTDAEPVREKVISRRVETIGKIRAELDDADALIIDSFQKLEWFDEVFKEYNLDFPGDLLVIANGGMYPGCMYVDNDYSNVAKAVMKYIKKLIKHPEMTEKMVLSGLIKRNFLLIS